MDTLIPCTVGVDRNRCRKVLCHLTAAQVREYITVLLHDSLIREGLRALGRLLLHTLHNAARSI